MKKALQDYQKLHNISQYARTLTGISHLLEWDQETYMPPGAAESRGVQLKTLAGLIHAEKTGKKFSQALGKLIDIPSGKILVDSLSTAQKVALKEWRRDYLNDKALPKAFVEEFTQLISNSMVVWRKAKVNSDFKSFAPLLEKIVKMTRKKAELLGYEKHPYDALLDLYEPGSSSKKIEAVFTPLKKALVELVKKISKAKQVDDSFLFGDFSTEKQVALSHRILEKVGYDTNHGRLDFSSHPFSSAPHPTDSRITTRIDNKYAVSNLLTTLHEVGHALYEQGLPIEQYGCPLGEAISYGMHESQSRWWETRIGQSKGFWTFALPILQELFPNNFKKTTLDVIYRAVNKVEPSFIRVESDEVTYSLHVILRFQLEKALIEGSLSVKDVPEAWNATMKELLGITPPNNTKGCLQDVHWAMGGIGYFPTYTLGNLYAAHFFEAFHKQHPDWEKRVSSGDMLFIREWLRDNIHQHGKRYGGDELLKKVTKKPFSAEAYIQYLTTKYTKIYGL